MVSITCYKPDGTLLEYFTQWDVNRKLIIKGADMSSEPVFHFYNKFSKSAITVPSSVSENVGITVVVPNILLREDAPITAHMFYTSTDGIGESKYTLNLPVRPKKRPDNQLYTDSVTTVQQASGTFETNSNGEANIYCAFMPDTVIIYGEEYTTGGKKIQCNLQAVFLEDNENYAHRVSTFSQSGNNTGYALINAIIERSSSGFVVNRIWKSNHAGAELDMSNQPFSYTALKYT